MIRVSRGEEPADFDAVRRKALASLRWKPRARNNSARGAVTIRVLKLDANDLVELYDDHVETHIRPDICEARQALSVGDQAAFLVCWNRLSIRFTQPAMPFSALAYDVVDHFFPEGERADLGVVLARTS